MYLFKNTIIYLKWFFLIDISLWILYCLIKTYKVIGKCFINFKEGIIIFKDGNKFKIKINEINNIYFYYGGYEGEIYESDIIFSGTWRRSGAENYLVINKNLDNKT